MLSRQVLLEVVNELNSRYAGSKVGFIKGYRDQWFIGGYIGADQDLRQVLRLHFCQGRNTGRINSNGGYPLNMDITRCGSREEVFREFELLDHHKRRERDRLERRCLNCLHSLGRLTGNCVPSGSCGYERFQKKPAERGSFARASGAER